MFSATPKNDTPQADIKTALEDTKDSLNHTAHKIGRAIVLEILFF